MKKAMRKNMIFGLVLAMGLCSVAAVSAANVISADAAPADFQMETGASVRLQEQKPGIRWAAHLSESYYNTIKASVSEVYTMVNKVGADSSKAVKIAHTDAPTFADGTATFNAVIPYEIGGGDGQLTAAEFDKAVHIELEATTYIKLSDDSVITATADGMGVNRTMIGVANYHQLTHTNLSAEETEILRTYVGEPTKVEGNNYFAESGYLGTALNASGDVYVNAYKVGTATDGVIIFTEDLSVLQEESAYKLSVVQADKSVVYTDATYVASLTLSDSTGKFSYAVGTNATVEKKTVEGVGGYEITAAKNTKLTFNDPIELNDANVDIFKFTTSTPDVLADMIIRFTDYDDSSKGVAIRMANTASTSGYGWGATGATYYGSGNASDTLIGDDIGTYTAVTNDAARLGSGTANIVLRFNAAAEKKFSVYLPDPQYYGLGYKGDANPFSANNTTNKVNVSIEFMNNGTPATVFVTNIGGDFKADKVYETDASGKFTYAQGEASVAVQEGTGYQISASVSTTITYNEAIELNKGSSTNIFKFNTGSPSTLNQVTVRFTDYYDSSKGVAISMINASSKGYGWGDTAATYVRSGKVDDTFADDFGQWTAIGNAATYLAGGSASSLALSFDSTENKFYALLLDDTPWYYGLRNDNATDVFSAENTTLKVKVSIEIVTSGEPTNILVHNIGGDFFTVA